MSFYPSPSSVLKSFLINDKYFSSFFFSSTSINTDCVVLYIYAPAPYYIYIQWIVFEYSPFRHTNMHSYDHMYFLNFLPDNS